MTDSGDRPEATNRRTGFARDVIKLAGGTTIAQVVALAMAPILTRLYAPSAFGAAAQFAAVAAVIVLLSCFSYDISIVLPKSDEDGAVQLWVSLLLLALVTGVTYCVFLVLPESVTDRLGAAGIPGYAPLLAFAVASGGALNVMTYWNSRRRKYGRVGAARVSNTLVTGASQIGLAHVVDGGALGIVAGSLAGNGVAAGGLAIQVIRQDHLILRNAFSLRRMMSGMRIHWRFPAFNAPGAVMNSLSISLPVLILGIYFSGNVVGYYSLGFRVLGLPMSIVGLALGQVFYQRAAVARLEGGLDTLVSGVFSVLVDLGVLPFFVLAVAGKDIFMFVFGQPWAEAGVYVQILSVWTLVWFISSPLSTLFAVLDRQRVSLVMNAIILGTRAASLMIGGIAGNAILAVALFAGSGLAVYGYTNWYLITRAGVEWSDAWRIVGRAVVRGLLPWGIVVVVVLAGAAPWAVSCVSGGVIALNTLWAVRRWRGLLRSS